MRGHYPTVVFIGTSKYPWAIKFLWRTLQTLASWLKPSCWHWIVCISSGPASSQFLCLQPVNLLQRKCFLAPVELSKVSGFVGQDRSYLLHQSLNFISLQTHLPWCPAPGTSGSWELQGSARENGLFHVHVSPSAGISKWSSPVLLRHLPSLLPISAFVYSRRACWLLLASLRMKFV